MKHRKLANEELNRPHVEAFKSQEKVGLVIILDNIRSLNNIGSVFRTADAFAIEKIMLCGITAQPPHREINKTALGATESVKWEYQATTLEAIQEIKKEGYKVAAIEQTENSTLLNEFKPQTAQKMALIFGHEVKGVSQEAIDASDCVLEIPQQGTKHSLNISVSVGVVLWDISEKLKT